jgi:hypothetical protein
LHAKRDLAVLHEKLRPVVDNLTPTGEREKEREKFVFFPFFLQIFSFFLQIFLKLFVRLFSADQVKAEAIAQLRAWGAKEPFNKNDVSTMEQAMVAMYVDWDANEDRSQQLVAQAQSIFFKYNPGIKVSPSAMRINPMQALADRLSALLPARPAPAAPKQWSEVIAALLAIVSDDALSNAFNARVAQLPPLTDDTGVHWRNQPTFSMQLHGSIWLSIEFSQRDIIFADVDAKSNLGPTFPLLLTARAALSPDWLVALKKVRWPATTKPPRALE